jgi:uncharacterized protein (DUF1330 family)
MIEKTELTDHDLDVLLAEDPGGPVVMLNLLRFRPDGGREVYQEYVERVGAGMSAKYGLTFDYLGEGGPVLVGGDGHAWDMVALVRYPSRQAFVDMVRDPEYRAVAHLRTEALVDAVLQPTVPLGR